MQAASSIAPPQLPPPLRTSSDMASTWTDGDLDFDTAAEKIVKAHEWDGAHRDLPVGDLKTWAVSARDGRFALVPLAPVGPARRARGLHPAAAGAVAACARELPPHREGRLLGDDAPPAR
jgi:hypothetical protein